MPTNTVDIKALSDLSDTQKELIIKNTVNRYSHLHSFNQSLKTKEMLDKMQSNVSIIEKWSALYEYANNPLYHGSSFYKKCLQKELSEKLYQLNTPIINNDYQINKINKDVLLKLCFSSIKQIIKEILAQVEKEKICLNLSGFELVKCLQSNSDSREKWDNLLAFCQDTNNQVSNKLAEIITQTIRNHNFRIDVGMLMANKNYADAISVIESLKAKTREDYECSAQCYIKLNKYNCAVECYEKVLTSYEQLAAGVGYARVNSSLVQAKIESTTIAIAECAVKAGNSKKAWDTYLSMNTKGGLKGLHNNAFDVLHDMLIKGEYLLYFDASKPQERASYTKNCFLESARGMGEFGAFPGLGLGVVTATSIPNPLTPAAGIAVALSGGLIGAVAGTIHGFFRAHNRHFFGIDQQREMILKLQGFASQDSTTKYTLAKAIADEYRKKRTYSHSDSSTFILNELEYLTEQNADSLWKKLEAYMLYQKYNLFKNNGKKLFLIISAELDQFYNNLEQQKFAIRASG